MKRIVSALAIAFAITAPATAQTQPNVSNTPSAQSSGTGTAGQPGNKNGPPAKPGAIGASTGTNTTVQQQDTSNIKGLPGSKSGPAVRKPDEK